MTRASITVEAGGVRPTLLSMVSTFAGAAAALAVIAHVIPELVALPASMLGIMPLYHRLNRQTTFDNDTRRRIYEHVEEMPGACIADIATIVGVSHSTASYHLDKLADFNLIASTQDGNKMRFFVRGGAYSEEERVSLAALDNAETRRVLRTIVDHPQSYRAELTELLGVSSPTVNWHLERLMRCDFVLETRAGRNRFLAVDRARAVRVLSSLVSKLETTEKDLSGISELLRGIVASDDPHGVRRNALHPAYAGGLTLRE